MRGFQRQDDGDVTLTMSQDDYDRLLLICGQATVARSADPLLTRDKVLGFINRVLVPGNPSIRAYHVSDRERDHPFEQVAR